MSPLDGFLAAFAPSLLPYLLLGVALGMFFGIVPGLTATMGVALLTPLAFRFPPAQGLAIILGVYIAAMFGGDITAILINMPGTPASIAVTFDGYAMMKQGRAGLALGLNALASAGGSLFGLIALALVAIPLANFALRFGPPEYFALALFGLSMMISVSGMSVVKGLLVGLLGMLLATVGFDPIVGYPRFAFGNPELLSGLSFIPIMIGIFGVAEVLDQVLQRRALAATLSTVTGALGRLMPNRAEVRQVAPPFFLSSAIGTVVGAIPGAGGDIASILSWDQAKRISTRPEEFGKGSIEGLVAAQTANNSIVGGALATTLALGVPGDTVTAVLIGILLIWGLKPGPLFFRDHLPLFYEIVGICIVATIISGLLSIVRARGIVGWVVRLDRGRLWAIVLASCAVGTYALNNSAHDVWLMLIAGVVGLVLRRQGFPPGPLVLGLILGPIAESNLRRSLAMSAGDWGILVGEPIAAVLLGASVLALGLASWQRARHQTPDRAAGGPRQASP